jgi:P22 coat protein - gene protein 5
MANTLITTSYLTNEALEVLENNLVFAKKVNREYADDFAQKDFKIGATVNVRRPARYIGTFGPNLNVEDTNQTYVPVSINYQFHVDAQFTTADMELQMGDFRPNVLEPAVAAVFNRIDSDGAFFAYQNTALSLGTPGVSPQSYKTFSDTRATLMSEGAPRGKIPDAILDPFSMSSIADSLKGLFNPQVTVSDIYDLGLVAKKTAGLNFYEDQNIPVWTSGPYGNTSAPVLAGITTSAAGTALMSGGWAQTGTFLTSGWKASTGCVVVGDIIQVAGVFPVNPQNRGQYGKALKQFVVLPPGGYAPMTGAAQPGGPAFAPYSLGAGGTFTAGGAIPGLYTSTAGGLITLTVAECMITGGQFQNCTTNASFTGTPALTVNGQLTATAASNGSIASPQSIVLLKDAFALAFVDLPLPRGVQEAARANSKEIGMSLRVVTQYTINNDSLPTRFDVAYGYSSMYRQQAQRVAG